MPVSTYTRLSAGRATPAQLAANITIEGNPRFAQTVINNLAFTI